jgi:hypothetical protein
MLYDQDPHVGNENSAGRHASSTCKPMASVAYHWIRPGTCGRHLYDHIVEDSDPGHRGWLVRDRITVT